jgi:hypothetical protein
MLGFLVRREPKNLRRKKSFRVTVLQPLKALILVFIDSFLKEKLDRSGFHLCQKIARNSQNFGLILSF